MDTSHVTELVTILQNVNISKCGNVNPLPTENTTQTISNAEQIIEPFHSVNQSTSSQPQSEGCEIEIVSCMSPDEEAQMRSLGLPISFATTGRARPPQPHIPPLKKTFRSSNSSSSESNSSCSTTGSGSAPSNDFQEVSKLPSAITRSKGKTNPLKGLKPIAPLLTKVTALISSKAESLPKSQHLVFVSSDEETEPLANRIPAMSTTDLTIAKPASPSVTPSAVTQPAVSEGLSRDTPSSSCSQVDPLITAAHVEKATAGNSGVKRTGRPKAAHLWSEFLLNPPLDLDIPHAEPYPEPAHRTDNADVDEESRVQELEEAGHRQHRSGGKKQRQRRRRRRRDAQDANAGEGAPSSRSQQKNVKEYVPEWVAREPELRRYWRHRYEYFSRFDRGIWLDARALYSVTPEPIARHQAKRCRCDVVIEACAGAGGNAIQLARTCGRVIALDVDATQLLLARHNAAVYGVERRIEFVNADSYALLPHLRADVLYLAPPWGGPDYVHKEKLSLREMKLYSLEGACGCSTVSAAVRLTVTTSTSSPSEPSAGDVQMTTTRSTDQKQKADGDSAAALQTSPFTCRKCGQPHEVSVWQLLERAAAHRRRVCPLGVALFLPRNVDRDELLAVAGLFKTLPIAPDSPSPSAAVIQSPPTASPAVPDAYTSGRVAIEENMVNDFTKAITAYFGDALVDAEGNEERSQQPSRPRRCRPSRANRKPTDSPPPNADAAASTMNDVAMECGSNTVPTPSVHS